MMNDIDKIMAMLLLLAEALVHPEKQFTLITEMRACATQRTLDALDQRD